MDKYITSLQDIDKTNPDIVGGKAANLGELFRIGGIQVPGGFCVTTAAYEELTANNQALYGLMDELSQYKAEDRIKINKTNAEIRSAIENMPIPDDFARLIRAYLAKYGKNHAYAVRSSATAEDLPSASFAGQQDTYLNIIGEESILNHIRKCWASLYTDRAVIYRIQNGIGHGKVSMAVVVQKMVFSEVSGIMFTSDPVSGNRKVLSIDASFGLGEALVSGLVNADNYKVKNGEIIDKIVSAKYLATYNAKDGGTITERLEPERQNLRALTDEQILQLERIGRKIEAHFGCPQDIEWCLADGIIYIVQSRPITTLYPIPEHNDEKAHVYLSVGHQQMMTDAMMPLGLSVWQLTSARPMHVAGGRLFVDIGEDLASPAKRNVLVTVLGKSDPLIKDALITLLAGSAFEPGNAGEPVPDTAHPGRPPVNFETKIEYDPEIVPELVRSNELLIESLKHDIQTKSGSELIDFILDDIGDLKRNLANPKSFAVFMTAMNASSWLNEKMLEWLGEKNVADILTQSVPGNITSEMGLALMDVADVIRPYPEVINYLQHVKDENLLDGLTKFHGGIESQNAIAAFLDKYGMRCAGEIDITKTRWNEKPEILIPAILNNIKNFARGEGKRKFERGLEQALKKERELVEKLMELPDGEEKANETKRMIQLVRNYSGYREYPKYSIVCRYFIYKQALLNEAAKLVRLGLIKETKDIYFLTMQELRKTVDSGKLDIEIINKRKNDYRQYKKLQPPRVMTSDGEIITGNYKRENLPATAIPGLAVSTGIVEGRARVILNMENADIEDGDILVTSFTDPSWTPLFVSIKGLVTEVGGLMTHGAVIAREYGLPAVVGVENATKLIKDGQIIRVNGSEGWVEII